MLQNKLRQKREKKRIKRKKIIAGRLKSYGEKSSALIEMKRKQMSKKKKGKKVEIKKEKPKPQELPDAPKIQEVKTGFFKRIINTIFNK